MNMQRQLRLATVLGTVSLALVLLGCAGTPPLRGTLDPNNPQRSQRLTALAAEEAALIPDVDARLTRLLNLADTQIQRGWNEDAKTTLAAARTTLASPDAMKLNQHARISGWVSVSELCRAVRDMAGAGSACEGAIAAVLGIADPARRCQYVMGVANELQYLRGKPAAVDFLTRAGPWTRSIDDVPARRQATSSFAAALFNLDDFQAGQNMLKQDDDPVWRADTLARFASISEGGGGRGASQIAAEFPQFGRDLRYRQVFQGQVKSQTVKD
jgi:hypothetical protein